MTVYYPGIDYQNQPLTDAWWTPGWTAQNESYLAVIPGIFSEPGFPPGLTYVNVNGNFFDYDGNPLSGYLDFWPSSNITISVGGGTTYIPQRYAGTNQTMLGLNQFGNGRIYLWNGQLAVTLLATNNANMTPTAFTYHVTEHFFNGNQYDINVPVSSANPVDIHSLIIPGSLILPDSASTSPVIPNVTVQIAAISTQYVTANITTAAGGVSFNPLSDTVQFAFILNGARQPLPGDWVTGSWATTSQPYIAQALVGPNSGNVLATGTYVIWVQVLAAPQSPAIPVGYLVIY